MRLYILFILISVIFLPGGYACADTIFLKDGEEAKGIVVEDFHDRITLSTIEGERQLNKADIRDILFDRQEQNLVKLGDFHEKKGNIIKAYTYFRKAYQLNPSYREAQEKFIHIRSLLLRGPEQKLRDDIARKRVIMMESGKVYSPKIAEGVPLTIEDKFRGSTGLTLIYGKEMPKVEEVIPDSPSAIAGIRQGDLIYSIWGRLTGYMELSAIETMILDNLTPEISLGIQRSVIIEPGRDKGMVYGGVGGLGFNLIISEEDGLAVKEVSEGSIGAKEGLSQGDIIVSIEDKPTRYMPLAEAVRMINAASVQGRVELGVVRYTTLWRKDKEI